MLKFTCQRSGPPGGMYFYETPDTKVLFRHPTMEAVLRAVYMHYHENGITAPDNLEALVQDQMCLLLPESFCTGDDEGRPRPKIVTLASIRKNTLELAAGNPRVGPGVAERRGRTCSNCPYNDRTGCTTCTGITDWARKVAGATLSGLDAALGICQIDCTALSAKVHLSEIPDSDEYPETCWRNK